MGVFFRSVFFALSGTFCSRSQVPISGRVFVTLTSCYVLFPYMPRNVLLACSVCLLYVSGTVVACSGLGRDRVAHATTNQRQKRSQRLFITLSTNGLFGYLTYLKFHFVFILNLFFRYLSDSLKKSIYRLFERLSRYL